MRTVDCIVVGGGPAGLAAARSAASAGVGVMLVDENRQPGGQYYRQMPASFHATDPSRIGKETVEGRQLIDEIHELGIELRVDTVVWALFDGLTVALSHGEQSERVVARTLVLAPGAYDRPVPFPGWTLPGVMTAGGAQNLMKAYRVLPGRRVLVVGSGPLMLVVAHYLLRGGAEVTAVCEAASMHRVWRHGLRLLPHLNFVQQGFRYHKELHDAGVPLLTGHVIRRALGTTEVTAAEVAACDEEWRPVAGTERRFDVDAIVVGYGFVPSLELPRLAGCEQRYVPEVDAWVPVRNRDLESSVANVWVAGDGAGVTGSAVALAEGHLAGLAVARRLGRLEDRAWLRDAARARGRLSHLAGFRVVMDAIYRVGSGLSALADDETVLCRCEEVTVGEALAAVREGATQLNEVKAWTRAGMGRCQGRMCAPALAHLAAAATGRTVADAGVFTPRPPVKPISMAALVNEVNRDGSEPESGE